MTGDNIVVFTQNSIRIQASIGRIYVDPFQMREEPKDADYLLITHDHPDHFSPEDIRKVCRPETILIVPEKMTEKAKEVSGLVSRMETVRPGEQKIIGSLEFETVPAYNLLKPFHPKKAGWVGYILKVDGERIYIAGDTDPTVEAKSVRCDVALVPIGGGFTMNAKKAAEMINEIQPKLAIPVHYGGMVGTPKDAETFAELVKPPVAVDIRKQY